MMDRVRALVADLSIGSDWTRVEQELRLRLGTDWALADDEPLVGRLGRALDRQGYRINSADLLELEAWLEARAAETEPPLTRVGLPWASLVSSTERNPSAEEGDAALRDMSFEDRGAALTSEMSRVRVKPADEHEVTAALLAAYPHTMAAEEILANPGLSRTLDVHSLAMITVECLHHAMLFGPVPAETEESLFVWQHAREYRSIPSVLRSEYVRRREMRHRYLFLSPAALVPLVCESIPDATLIEKLVSVSSIHSMDRTRLLEIWRERAESGPNAELWRLRLEGFQHPAPADLQAPEEELDMVIASATGSLVSLIMARRGSVTPAWINVAHRYAGSLLGVHQAMAKEGEEYGPVDLHAPAVEQLMSEGVVLRLSDELLLAAWALSQTDTGVWLGKWMSHRQEVFAPK